MKVHLATRPYREETSIPCLPAFEFRLRGRALIARGLPRRLAPGPAETLDARLAAGFGAGDARAVIAGAMPFEEGEDDCLWVAEALDERPLPRVEGETGASAVRGWSTRECPPRAEYCAAVAKALGVLAEERRAPGGLRKIVLARTLRALAERDIDLAAVLSRLAADPAATAYLVELPASGARRRHLVGATPELLLGKRGARITSHPLAGSARRQADPAADAETARALHASAKDRREHAFVVEYILDTLAPLCTRLGAPAGAEIVSTQTMWHLGTRIEGDLKTAETPSAVLAALLHPTPAVGGTPTARAAGLIAELEANPRGFYSGAVGWCEARGDGAWYVALRCADVSGREACLYAGAGIVAGSEPQSEAEETQAKFAALLRALGLEGAGGGAGDAPAGEGRA